jgi:3-hydroxyisobutyrate dehydrogenase-like beta-hydroxyacid dehydrogenase
MATGDYRASFELTMARKDVQLMLETAASGGQVPHVLPAIAHRMDALIAEGHGARDFAVLAVDTIPTQVG